MAETDIMERVRERTHLRRTFRPGRCNRGIPDPDVMTVDGVVSRYAVVAISLLAGLALFGCTHESSTPPPGPCSYSGVTVTDSAGNIISDDLSDWCPYPRYGVGWTWALYPATPNPARVMTTIEFGGLANSVVVIDIKDCSANAVRTFHPASGVHKVVWDLTDAQGRRVAPGLYRCYFEVAYPNTLYTCNGDIQVLAP